MGVYIARLSFLLFLLAAIPCAQAQTSIARNDSAAELPDAPGVSWSTVNTPHSFGDQHNSRFPSPTTPRPAPRLAKYIEPDQTTAPLSVKEKLELSGWEQVQPYSVGTQVLAAGWEHLLNSNPKYGTDSAGFGERLGAAAIRQGSQAVFSDGVFAAALHEDPRYYVKGTGGIASRIVYAATRVVVIRNDAGAETTNYSELFGYAGAAALTMTYYPAVSATWPNTAEGYILSLGASALGNQVHEFWPDIVQHLRVHLHR